MRFPTIRSWILITAIFEYYSLQAQLFPFRRTVRLMVRKTSPGVKYLRLVMVLREGFVYEKEKWPCLSGNNFPGIIVHFDYRSGIWNVKICMRWTSCMNTIRLHFYFSIILTHIGYMIIWHMQSWFSLSKVRFGSFKKNAVTWFYLLEMQPH